MKVAIYCRVSRSDLELENQLLPLKKYAEFREWNYTVFTEKESTRRTRPVAWELYNKLLKREYDALLVYRLDRWGRSLTELVQTVGDLSSRGVKFISYSENIDFTTAAGKLQFHIFASMAEYERALIRERTLEGLDRARAWGKKLGRPPGSKDKKKRKKRGPSKKPRTIEDIRRNMVFG